MEGGKFSSGSESVYETDGDARYVRVDGDADDGGEREGEGRAG